MGLTLFSTTRNTLHAYEAFTGTGRSCAFDLVFLTEDSNERM